MKPITKVQFIDEPQLDVRSGGSLKALTTQAPRTAHANHAAKSLQLSDDEDRVHVVLADGRSFTVPIGNVAFYQLAEEVPEVKVEPLVNGVINPEKPKRGKGKAA